MATKTEKKSVATPKTKPVKAGAVVASKKKKAGITTAVPVPKTTAERTANLKARLKKEGGTRMSLNLDGESVQKLKELVKKGVAPDHSQVIRELIRRA